MSTGSTIGLTLFHSARILCVWLRKMVGVKAGVIDNRTFSSQQSACEAVCPTSFPPLISLPQGSEILTEQNKGDSLVLPVDIREGDCSWLHREWISVFPDVDRRHNLVEIVPHCQDLVPM